MTEDHRAAAERSDASRYRQRAAEVRAAAALERYKHQRDKRLAYADQLDKIASRLEAEAVQVKQND